VDRSFSARGFGTVVTGTLVSGCLAAGEEIAVLPGGAVCRVRGIQVHGKPASVVSAGRRTAVNLQGIDTHGVQRGDVLSRPGAMRPTSLLDVSIALLRTAPGKLKDMDRVRYHQGTSELLARVKLLGVAAVAPGETAFAQLRLERPACSLRGDRFVLRRYSPAATIGGGVVLDGLPAKHRGRARGDRLGRLARLKEAGSVEAMEIFALDAPSGASLGVLAPRLGIAADEAAGLVKDVLERGAILKAGEGTTVVLIARAIVEEVEERIKALLAAHHKAHPLKVGMPLEELRKRALGGLDPEAVRLVLQRLARAGAVAIEKDLARLAAHRVTLSGDEERRRGLLEEAYRAGGLNPPAPDEAARAAGLDPKGAESLTRLLLSDGRLVKIKDGIVFHATVLEELKRRLWAMRSTRSVIDIGAFKELTGTSRKNAIPLLEHLDALHVTRRVGSDREILPPAGG
jgi:selenocysteine-specific elongation factor